MYTRGLGDTGDMFSAIGVWCEDPTGVPCTGWGWKRWECRVRALQGGQKGDLGGMWGPNPAWEVPPCCGDNPVPTPADTYWT